MADELTVSQRAVAAPAPDGEPPPEATFLKLMEDALVAMRRASKDLAFYPAGHPSLQASLERVTQQLRRVVGVESPLSLTVSREAISHRLGDVGKSHPLIRSFAGDLFLAQVRRFHVGAGFSQAELVGFLGLVNVDPKKILLQGGPDALLAAAGVRHIQVNALRFKPVAGEQAEGGAGLRTGGTDLMDAIAPVQGEELREAPTQSAQTRADGSGEILGGQGEKAELLLRAASAPVVIQEESATLVELLNRLEGAEGLEYGRLAHRLEGVARNAVQQGEVESFLLIVSAFARHREDGRRSPESRAAASRWLSAVAEAGGLAFLVDRLCGKDASYADEIVEVLGRLGGPAVEALVVRLGIEENMFARRRLVAAIVRQGPAALPQLLRGLQDERWFVVRNMASILGELGNEEAIEDLGRHARHPDHRVRREVVRALAKIGGRQVVRFLREALADPDAVTRQTAIAFVGTARDPLCLQPLLAMAEERARDREWQEVRKAAILALGSLGNPAALPVLVRLMAKGSWLRRREPEDIRIAAAGALGMLGGPGAADALRAGQRSGGRVGAACEQALHRLKP